MWSQSPSGASEDHLARLQAPRRRDRPVHPWASPSMSRPRVRTTLPVRNVDVRPPSSLAQTPRRDNEPSISLLPRLAEGRCWTHDYHQSRANRLYLGWWVAISSRTLLPRHHEGPWLLRPPHAWEKYRDAKTPARFSVLRFRGPR